ncbi:MAG: YicC family protein [Flavobacteriales bacterium]|nr:MAG: YicC family protein [Flavobacteriales bacterium]
MLRSMTGFGRAEGSINGKKITVELRSLNSKGLDLMLKLAPLYREKESELRQWANERLVRGKVDVYIGAEETVVQKRTSFDAQLVKQYHDELEAIRQSVARNSATDVLGIVLRMPDVSRSASEELDENEWALVKQLLDEAHKAFQAFRASEGLQLFNEISSRVNSITALLTEVEPLDTGRATKTREKLLAKLLELQVNVDKDRFEQELIFYLEKMDVSEEKMRLRTHCTYFLDTARNEEQQGRKLGFIAQEIGREVNTLGSKANDAAIQQLVVRMKDELEKIKEQVLNVL